MGQHQPGIIDSVPQTASHLFFAAAPGGDVAGSLQALRDIADGNAIVVGLGQSLVLALGREVPGLGVFPRYAGAGFEVPSTPYALWCWLRGSDRGELVHRARRVERALAPGLRLSRSVDTFRFQSGLDLTGYEDGTENPEGAAALAAAVLTGAGAGLDGSSFVAVQQWLHDLDGFEAMTPDQQDNTIGRRKRDNLELEDAPLSAHVKRTAQESYQPAAFMLRRSMPWAEERRAGLMFVAFGSSFDAFEAQLRRMVGAEDGIADALFRFTRPLSGSYFWCPPLSNGRLNLAAVGLR